MNSLPFLSILQRLKSWERGVLQDCSCCAGMQPLLQAGCPSASSPAVILAVLVSTLEFSSCSHGALQPYGFVVLLWSCVASSDSSFPALVFLWYEELSQPVLWALALFIPKFVTIPWGTKNWEVAKVGRNSAGSSAHVRAGGEREEKEQQARDFLG